MKENKMIRLNSVTHRFRKKHALRRFDLSVSQGSAMALLGGNGAGKTTALRLVAGIYRLQNGLGEVLGHPPGAMPASAYQEFGYVSENQRMPGHWTVNRLLGTLAPMYPTWDPDFEKELVALFELPRKARLRTLSRGMRMKAALTAALAYRPRLLLMDEPFSGLDALVRDQFIDAVLELMQAGDWTLLLASHDMEEVERLCDKVTFIQSGRNVVSEDLENLQARFRRVSAVGATVPATRPASWWAFTEDGSNGMRFVDSAYGVGGKDELAAALGEPTDLKVETLSLREIYVALALHHKSADSLAS